MTQSPRLTQPLPPGLIARFAPLAAFFLGGAVFYLLRGFRLPGGDSVIILSNEWFGVLWSYPFVYYAREPLAHSLAHLAYTATGDLPMAFSLFSSLGGALFLAVMAAYCRRPLFWLVLLVSAASWNFIGHIEYYAPVMVALLIFFITLTRALEPEPRGRPLHAGLAFGVAYLTHKMTLFFLPSLFWLFFTRRDGRWRRRPLPPREVEWTLAAVIFLILADVLPAILINTWGARFNAFYVTVNEGLMDLLTPLTPGLARYFESKSITGMFYVYTFGQPKHFAYFFGFLLAGAPLGLPLVIRYWRRIFESDAARALATAAACGLIWTFFWQPRGFWKDWDLFCLAGLPINLLGASLALGLWRGSGGSADSSAASSAAGSAGILPASRREWLAAAAGLVLFAIVMSAAAVAIQAHRIRPGQSVNNLGDTPVLDSYPLFPLPFNDVERRYGVTLDRARARGVFVYPYQGLSTLWSPEGKATLAAADQNGIILSTTTTPY